MNKKNIIILISAIIILVIAIVFIIFVQKKENTDYIPIPTNEISYTKDLSNVKYSDFTIYKPDNTEVKLSDFNNKPKMLLFFNDKVEDSMEMLERVELLYNSYKDDVNIFVINVSQNVNNELENKYSFEIYYDFYEEAKRNYGISIYPSTIYIKEGNEIFNAKEGLATTDSIDANLEIIANNI